jgi:hypothetical protein
MGNTPMLACGPRGPFTYTTFGTFHEFQHLEHAR